MAILEGIQDGTIDAIACDHAPHEAYVKKCEFATAANGIIGLQTSLPLSLSLLGGGKVAPARLVDLLSAGPARSSACAARGRSPPARTPTSRSSTRCGWEFGPGDVLSKSKNSPFLGWKMRGARQRRSAEGGSATRRSRESRRMPDRKACLVLADGHRLRGDLFRLRRGVLRRGRLQYRHDRYQEVLTDPSYKGQIVTMTYPEIGNTGINPEDVESNRPWVEGFIVREAWGPPSNWRHVESLDAYLRRYHVCGIAGIDTRALTRRLRDGGSQMAVLSATDLDADRLARKARELRSLVGRDLVKEVTSDHPVHWTTGEWDLEKGYLPAAAFRGKFGRVPRIVAIDFGIKQNILRMMISHGFDVTVVPAGATRRRSWRTLRTASSCRTGRGTPKACRTPSGRSARSSGRSRCSGICLGHQIMGLALGGKTFKLKFATMAATSR